MRKDVLRAACCVFCSVLKSSGLVVFLSSCFAATLSDRMEVCHG